MSPARFQRHADIRLTALPGEGVVLHLKERKYFTVNETGLTLLESLQKPRTMSELVAALLAEYEVTPETAEETTRAFLDQCVGAAVVLEVPG